jgi:hypothetical protein
MAQAEILYGVSAHAGVMRYADTDDPNTWALKGRKANKSVSANGITFDLIYDDDGSGIGFDDASQGAARKAALETVLTYVASVLGESGTLDVVINGSQLDGGGFLASAGTYFSSSPGLSSGSANRRLIQGYKPYSSVEEIFVTVDFGYNWYAGSGTPGGGQFDLRSVLLHEITHGLGIITLCSSSGNSQIATGVYTSWDSMAERSNGSDLIGEVGGQPTFVGSVSDLVSNDVVLDSTNARSAYGSNPPVYSPGGFQPGSSLGHFGSGTGAVMTPSIAPQTVKREYQDFEIGALRDIGWPNASGGAPNPISIGFSQPGYSAFEGDAGAVDTSLTVELSAAPGSGNTVTVMYAVTGGTASGQEDYFYTSGMLTWNDFDTAVTIDISVLGDLEPETNETVEVTLNTPSGATINSGSATLTILDDDADTDGDGLSDKEEEAGTFGYVTDPDLFDTDGDGLNDLEESLSQTGYDTDPTEADTDNDGLDDGTEVDTTGTDPTVADTDGGGVNDGEEVTNETDPTDPADDSPSDDEPTDDEKPPADEVTDVNGNGRVDIVDLQTVVDAILSETQEPGTNPDVDNNGLVNLLDLQAVVIAILNR